MTKVIGQTADYAHFARGLLAMTHDEKNLMDRTTGPVVRLIAENDIVIGVWRDDREPCGVGLHIIKGTASLADIMATGIEGTHGVAALKCVDREQAVAAAQTLARKQNGPE
jgi:hypothetical protein